MHCFWQRWINMSIYDQISNWRSVWGISLRKWREHGDGIGADIATLVDRSRGECQLPHLEDPLKKAVCSIFSRSFSFRAPLVILMIWKILWVTLCHYFAGSVLPCHLLQDWSWQIQGNRYSLLSSLHLSQQARLFSVLTVVVSFLHSELNTDIKVTSHACSQNHIL